MLKAQVVAPKASQHVEMVMAFMVTFQVIIPVVVDRIVTDLTIQPIAFQIRHIVFLELDIRIL